MRKEAITRDPSDLAIGGLGIMPVAAVVPVALRYIDEESALVTLLGDMSSGGHNYSTGTLG